MFNNIKMIFVYVLTFFVTSNSVQAVMFDWMMPNFLSSNQDSFSDILGTNFKNSLFSLQNNMKNMQKSMQSNLEKMNNEFENIRIKTYTVDDMASVVLVNDNDTSNYYNTGGCNCVNQTCMCCAHLEVDEVNLNQTACLSLNYLGNGTGINFEFSVNHVTYLNLTISETNPPPVCVNVPEFKELASLCLNFYDMVVRKNSISGCLDVIVKLGGAEVARVKIGCFRSSPNSKFFQQNVISSRLSGNVTYFNQFNSDSTSNLIIRTVDIIDDNMFSTTNINSWKKNNFLSNSNRWFNNLKREPTSSEDSFKRRKRD